MRMKLSYVSILFIVAFATSGIKSQSVTDNLIDDANLNEYEKEEIDETLTERQSSDIGDPKEYLDAKILESMGKLPGLIAAAKQEIEDKLRFTLFKKNTQGWSIVAAGVNDIFGDWVGKDYKLQTQSQLYKYGFYFFYGLGFGLPALVGNPSLPPIDCGLENYQTTLDRYGLSFGPVNLVSQFGVKSAKSLVKEFDTFVRLDLACILDEEDNCESAAEVKWTLDNLIAAYNARLDLETFGPRITFFKGSYIGSS